MAYGIKGKTVVGFVIMMTAMTARGEELPSHFTAPKPLAMGGAYTAIANDENAVWTNPAGISRVRKARSRESMHVLRLPQVTVGANTKSSMMYNALQKQGSRNFDSVVDQANDLSDKPFYAVASIAALSLFDVSKTPMAFGAYTHTQVRAVVDKNNPTEARTTAVSDIGGVLGFAVANNSNRLNFGVIVRPMSRTAYEDALPITTLANKTEMEHRFKEDANTTSAVAVDLGFMYTVADFWFPTVGLAVINAPLGCRKDYLNPFSKERETVCGTKFYGKMPNLDAVSNLDPTDLRAGVSITPRLGRNLAARLAFDLHNINVQDGDNNYGLRDVDALKQSHLGLEIFVGNPLLPSLFSFMLGYGQGFYSTGGSAHLGFLTMELAVYGRDVSSTAKPVEDRRIVGSLAFDF